MSEKTTGRLGFLLAWLLMLTAAMIILCAIAGDGALLGAEMLRNAPPRSTGLPEAEYPGMGRMIADYLTGRQEAFQYTFSDGESTFRCFQPHEAAHMADCRGLIRLADVLRWFFGGLALLLTAAISLMIRNRERYDELAIPLRAAARGAFHGLTALALLASGMVIWGVLDFDGLFTLFHRLAFPNGGWLLDPRTDLLIRLMPTSFFISLGIRGGLWLLLCGGLLGCGAAMLRCGTRPVSRAKASAAAQTSGGSDPRI